MSDMDATMARVADIVGTLRGISGGAVRTASSSTVSSSTGSATATSTSSASTSESAASSAASFAAALDGATASTGTDHASSVGGTTGATIGALTGAHTGITSATSATSATGATAGGPDGDAVVADAERYLGVPYRWGGTNPSTGLDCSGLTQRVFADLGLKLPRTVAQQVHAGQAVSSMAQARPGDLLVFGTHHIGIYVGDGKMLHAPHTGDVVKVAKVYETPSAIRRIVGDVASGSTAGSRSSVAAATSTAYARPVVLRSSGSTAYDGLFAAATSTYDLPAGLLKSVARAESSFNPKAHSAAGAVGLMQLMPGTARELDVDPSDPAQAVDGAARLLRSHLDRFGSVRLAVAAYNAGAGAVSRYHDVPPYAETRTYVQRVLAGIGTVAA